MRRSAFLAFVPLLLAGCDAVAPPEVDYRPGEAGTVDHALCLLGFQGVPLRALSTGHHVVALTLNRRAATFVVDTGANMTVLDERFADAFGLTPGAGAAPTAIGIGGPLNARQARVDSFEIGGIPIRARRVVVAAIGQVSASLARFTGTEIHGILGQDVLGEHRAVIDVPRGILYLIEADRDPAPVPAALCRVDGGGGDGGGARNQAARD